MITFPKSKINLGLRITGKRSDGYHDIETVFYPVSLSDAMEFVESNGLSEDELVVTGKRINSSPGHNLIIKALHKIREKHILPFFRIHLHKAIPSGAGLGGGSSDAAMILKAVNKCYGLGLNNETMKEYALEIGSDCPFFLNPVPSLASGRGEILKPVIPFLAGYFIVIVNPGISISTGEAYTNCFPSNTVNSLETIFSRDPSEWRKLVINDFEDYVFGIHPGIGKIKDLLYETGAILSLMSGSGSTVYGIFKEKPGLPQQLEKLLLFEGRL